MLKKPLLVFIIVFACSTAHAQTAPPLVVNETLIAKLSPGVATAMTTQFDYLPWGYHVEWSPDMKRVAYWATNEKGMYLVVNGVSDKPYDVQEDGSPRGGLIPPPVVFSPDSQHYAYVARRDKKQFVVRDGKAGAAYDWIAPDDLHFSPDSQRMAYWARRGKKNLTVLHDGDKIKEFGFVPRKADAPQSFYNEDVLASQKPSWKVIERDKKQIIVYNGKEGVPYDFIHTQTLAFSADGKHSAWCAERDEKLFIIFDGVEAGKTYGAATGLQLPPLVFDTPASFHTLALRADKIFRVEVNWSEE